MAKNIKMRSIMEEDRIDDHSIDMFKGMGHTTMLSDETLKIFREVKRRHDLIRPGKMDVGTYALISVLGDMSNGVIDFEEKEEESKSAPKSED